MQPCLRAALKYANRGWAVFPLKGKEPLPGTSGHKDATTDRRTILQWWKDYPKANVGIRCDSTHGPIVVDIDGPSGEDLVNLLDLPPTREAGSRRGRWHLYFGPMESGARVGRIIKVAHKGVKHALDILGDGGYVVAPPSIHPETGKPYRWLEKVPVVPLPKSIFRLVRSSAGIKQIAAPLPDVITEGNRDNLLTSLAGSMRRRGASEESILAALREENATRVRPPLPERSLLRIAKSIARKTPVATPEHFTDLGNARRFVQDHHATVRSVYDERNPWRFWDGRCWVPDTTGGILRRAKETIRNMHHDAGVQEDEDLRDAMLKHAFMSEGAARIHAMLDLAATEPEVSIKTDQFDSNPWLFNVNNGTIDLRTGKLRNHKRTDLITQLAPVDYDEDAAAPRWEQFLMEIMNGDHELVEFLRRAVGYSLTGDIREHCLFFCYGKGANGKSTFLETLRAMDGSYARQSDFSSFLAKSNDGPRTDIARMRGARLVTASEAGNRDFDAKTVQMLTGDDVVLARRLYEHEFEFRPQHKLWLAANHKPVVKEQTEAFWRRMRLIPFMRIFATNERDKKLPKRLRKELPGILAWAVAGCLEWQEHGLLVPSAIRKATMAYKDENDLLGEFFTSACKLDPTAWTPTNALYRVFIDWWQDSRGTRSQPPSITWFGRMLSERSDLKLAKRKNIRGWAGVMLKSGAKY